MYAHNSMKCVIKNQTNKKITLVVFLTYITTYKSSEEIYNEHTDVFPRQLEHNEENTSKFYITFHHKTELGLNNYDDYFDEDEKVHCRTRLFATETISNGTIDGDQ